LGAISLARTTLKPEDAFIKRAQQRVEEKVAIARKALAYFKSASTLYLDSGSTLMEFARLLPDDEYLALTSGPNIALELALKTRPEVMLLGGKVAKNNLSVSGALAMDMIDRVNVDVAFMAASGFDRLSGFTAGSLEECALKHRVITRAKQRVVLMDSSKLGLVHAFSYASALEIDVLITDMHLGQEMEQYFAQNKVTIIYAQEDNE
jgi:DeoR/GlpR family transcriptional regulator of sugar metabolism